MKIVFTTITKKAGLFLLIQVEQERQPYLIKIMKGIQSNETDELFRNCNSNGEIYVPCLIN